MSYYDDIHLDVYGFKQSLQQWISSSEKLGNIAHLVGQCNTRWWQCSVHVISFVQASRDARARQEKTEEELNELNNKQKTLEVSQ